MVNLAKKYSDKVDERFSVGSQALAGTSDTYKFTGVATVEVYSIPTAAQNDYQRTGSNRYGEPEELQDKIQTLTISRDRSFTFTIDKGSKLQSEMVRDAGKALARQLREVSIPEFDTWVFAKQAEAAIANGNYSEEPITRTNAYEQFLKATEVLGNNNVPDEGRIAFCSYAFANMIKLDESFSKQGDSSQEMVINGTIGYVDGVKIVRVPSSRLPVGTAFLLVHPSATTAPKQLADYKVHDDPPGINGWLVEGRMIYDAFVLDSKSKGVYFHGGQGILRTLQVQSVAGDKGKSVITVTPSPGSGNKMVYKTGTEAETPEFDEVLSGWTDLPADGVITPTASHTTISVAEVDASNKAKSLGSTTLSIGA